MNTSLEMDSLRIEHPGARYRPCRCNIRVNVECNFAGRCLESKRDRHDPLSPLATPIGKPGKDRCPVFVVDSKIDQAQVIEQVLNDATLKVTAQRSTSDALRTS